MKPVKSRLFFCLSVACILAVMIFYLPGRSRAQLEKSYVGSQACGECHADQYENFSTYSKKTKSYENIKVMKKGLTDSEFKTCMPCHTTGYGEPGGFVSMEETPDLSYAGCEVCHGPGSVHAESEDPADIKATLSIEDCDRCHTSERVENFHFKPLLFGGAH